MNSLIKIGAGLFAVFIFFSMASQCSRRQEPVSQKTSTPAAVSTDMIMREYAKGLDLKAVSELAKKAKDGPEFERLLNDSKEAVNNLDLNDDDKVDYIKITEFGSGDRKGFSLTTEVEPGKAQEIATIEFKKEAQGATVQTTGNPSLYGPGYFHNSSFGLTDMLLLGWLFSDRPNYASPYGGGIYPSGYGGGWPRRPSDQYTSQMSGRTATSTFNRSSTSTIGAPLTSPNATQTAARAKAIANPTQSQRSFATRTSEGPTRSGGFGKSSNSSSSTSSPSRPSSGGSSSYNGSSTRSSGSYGSSSSSGGFGRSSSSGSSRSGGFSGGGK